MAPLARLTTAAAALVLAALGGACSAEPAPAPAGADAVLAALRADAPAIADDWPGVGTWTPERRRLESTEARLLLERVATPSTDVEAELGELYTRVGEYGRGLAFLVRALGADPERAECWSWLGKNRLATGRPDEARVLLERALELHPDLTSAYYHLAEVHTREGDAAAARAALEDAIELNPRHFDARLRLANHHEDAGDWEAAVAELERALELDPDHPTPLFRMARALRELGRDDEAAELEQRHRRAAILEDLRLRDASIPVAEQLLAVANHLYADGRWAEAAAEYEGALERAADRRAEAAALSGLVLCAQNDGRTADAERWLARLERAAPEHPLVERARAAGER